MIRKKREEELGRQTLLADYGGWHSYREAVSYIIRRVWTFVKIVITLSGRIESAKHDRQ
jgi:hypothetical protein